MHVDPPLADTDLGGAYGQLAAEAELCGRRTTHRGSFGRLLHRRLRTLCEDLDELLGKVGEAVRRHRVTVAAPLLVHASAVAGELAWHLSAAEPTGIDAVHPSVDSLHEEDLLRTLTHVRDLDAELHRAAHGEGDGEESLRAAALLAEIQDLAEAARSEVARGSGGITRHAG